MNPIVKLESQKVVEYLKGHAKQNTKLQTVFAIREFLQELGSYENSIDGLLGEIYAEEKMKEFIDRDFEILNQFPPSETRDYLYKLVNYTTERKY